MKIDNFRDLECWRKARELVKRIYKLTNNEAFSKDYGFKDQIRRSAVSVMANIAEGFGFKSAVEFIRFLSFSIRSAYEVQPHLFAAFDIEYISSKEHIENERIAEDCIALCKGLVSYLKNKT